MRKSILSVILLVMVGCGTSAASSSTPTPANTPTPGLPIGARFSRPPSMTINVNHHYTAKVLTTDGAFYITLLPKLAPVTVNNFVFLARHHFYDGNLFHRIIRTFMIQTGDPTGTGSGGPGYEFKDELSKTLRYTPGTVAMANLGQKNTNGSQFFIVTGADGLGLAPSYTIFGKVTQGMNVVQKIAQTPVTTNIGTGEPSQPLEKVLVLRISIVETR